MHYILCEIATDNINFVEESILGHLEDDVSSLITSGLEGFEVENNNILDLSFSRWSLKIIPKDGGSLNYIMDALKGLFKDGIISCSIVEDNTNYLELSSVKEKFSVGRFTLFNNVEDFNLSSIKNSLKIMVHETTAFGTGKHETTSMCLELMDQISENPISLALDVGTGTGILAIAMVKIWNCQVDVLLDIGTLQKPVKSSTCTN